MVRRKNRDRGANVDWRAKKRARDRSDSTERTDSWHRTADEEPVVVSESEFGKFYKRLVDDYNLFDAAEWPLFEEYVQKMLPSTFRITESSPLHAPLVRALKDCFPSDDIDITVDGEDHKLPHVIPWYPRDTAWQTTVPKRLLKRIAELKPFRESLVALEASGDVTRQEAVSMVPPLFLDVQPHHAVLDLCAAPGSKTTQIIDAMCSQPNVAPTGFVIANDTDRRRAYMLSHQCRRFETPNVLITVHDAAKFPKLSLYNEAGKKTRLLYDRILADVPCSGDGTSRKNGEVLRKFTPRQAFNLHRQQISIAMSGARDLAIGGRMVYSTCSMNPLEDEAVVAEIIRRSGGALQLVDASDTLPTLRRRAGVTQWPVVDYQDSDKVLKNVDDGDAKRVVASMFPQPDLDTMHMERCMRFLPHDQDTGGFFVAVLEKTRHFAMQSAKKDDDESDTKKESVDDDDDDGDEGNADVDTNQTSSTQTTTAVDENDILAASRVHVPSPVPQSPAEDFFAETSFHYRVCFHEEPFVPVARSEALVTSLRADHDADDAFIQCLIRRVPRIDGGVVWSDLPRVVHLVSPRLAPLFASGEVYRRLKVVHAGMKLFEVRDKKAKKYSYRVSAAAAQTVLPYFSDQRRVHARSGEIESFLQTRVRPRDSVPCLKDFPTTGTVMLFSEKLYELPLTRPLVLGVDAFGQVRSLMSKESIATLSLMKNSLDWSIGENRALNVIVRLPASQRTPSEGSVANDDGDENENKEEKEVNEDEENSTKRVKTDE